MGGKRKDQQLEPALMAELRREAPRAVAEWTELPAGNHGTDNPASTVTALGLPSLVDGRLLNQTEPPWYGPVRPVASQGKPVRAYLCRCLDRREATLTGAGPAGCVAGHVGCVILAGGLEGLCGGVWPPCPLPREGLYCRWRLRCGRRWGGCGRGAETMGGRIQ